jgi:hypothetical protein
MRKIEHLLNKLNNIKLNEEDNQPQGNEVTRLDPVTVTGKSDLAKAGDSILDDMKKNQQKYGASFPDGRSTEEEITETAKRLFEALNSNVTTAEDVINLYLKNTVKQKIEPYIAKVKEVAKNNNLLMRIFNWLFNNSIVKSLINSVVNTLESGFHPWEDLKDTIHDVTHPFDAISKSRAYTGNRYANIALAMAGFALTNLYGYSPVGIVSKLMPMLVGSNIMKKASLIPQVLDLIGQSAAKTGSKVYTNDLEKAKAMLQKGSSNNKS